LSGSIRALATRLIPYRGARDGNISFEKTFVDMETGKYSIGGTVRSIELLAVAREHNGPSQYASTIEAKFFCFEVMIVVWMYARRLSFTKMRLSRDPLLIIAE
jgi:hypothetical protein